MPGIVSPTLASRLVRLQSFKETTWGTPGLATSRWMGVQPFPQFKPYQKSTIFDEDRGSLQNSFLSAVLVEGGEFNLNMHATYEDINYILQGGMQAVDPSGGGPYIWTRVAPTTAAWYVQPYTLEHGYDQSTIGASGCLFNKWTIKGSSKKQWEISASGFFKTYYNHAAVAIASSTNAAPIEITATAHGYTTGNQVIIANHLLNTAANGTWTIIVTSANTFTLTGSIGIAVGGASGTSTQIQTPAISDRAVEVILFPGSTLKMEASGGTLGTTSYSNQFLSFQYDYNANLVPVYGSDTKSPITFTYDKVTPTVSLKLLYTDQVKAFINTTLKAGQRALVQIKSPSGTKDAELDMAGVLIDDPTYYPNEQSAVAVDIKLEGQYEATSLANQAKTIITNSVSALP